MSLWLRQKVQERNTAAGWGGGELNFAIASDLKWLAAPNHASQSVPKRAASRAFLRFFKSVKSVTYRKRLMGIRTLVILNRPAFSLYFFGKFFYEKRAHRPNH